MNEGEEIKINDTILSLINDIIQKIELEDNEGLDKIQVRTRNEILDLHLASIKYMLL